MVLIIKLCTYTKLICNKPNQPANQPNKQTNKQTNKRTNIPYNTGWNDKIVALEKTWFYFGLMKTGFPFFVADRILVGQLCTDPKSDRSLLSCLKVTQCSTSKIGDVPLYNPCPLPIQVITARTIAGLPLITGTCPGWWKQSFRLRLWSLVWFQVRATSCHLTSSKSAWKSTTKEYLVCWRVWWSPCAIRWPLADPGGRSWVWQQDSAPAQKSKETQAWLQKECYDLYPSLTGPLLPRPESAGLLRLVIRREHHQHHLP